MIRTCAAAVMFLVLVMIGCQTYVNIPAQPGDVAWNNPNAPSVHDVQLAAFRALLDKQGIDGPFRFVLPDGTNRESYEWMYVGIGHGAVFESDQSLPVVQVKQVRIRGLTAQVDMVRPVYWDQPNGPNRVITVTLKRDVMAGWVPDRVHTWQLASEDVFGPTDVRQAEAPTGQ